jgi:hypothetical protein
MNKKSMTILTAASLCAAVCSAAPRVTLLKQVGPDPALPAQNTSEGFLQVYSARERAPIDVNAETYFYNNDFGKNEYLRQDAHTSYAIYALDGRLLQRVRNTTGMNDANPTLVKLAPGVYHVKAEAEDSGEVTQTVTVPVCVEAGRTTTVHLDGKWKTTAPAKDTEMVRLHNGNVVGWYCPGSDEGKYASNTRN